MAVSRSLEVVRPSSVARGSGRSYELGLTPAAALGLLRSSSGYRVVSAEQAEQAQGTEPFIVVGDDGFTIYKPWRSPNGMLEGALTGDIAVGPAVVGQLEPTPRGARLELRVKPYAPPPGEQTSLRLGLGGLAFFVLSPLLLGGLSPITFGLSALMLAFSLAGLVSYQRLQRAQDIRDLLAIAERTFGPRELPAAEDAPHRRDG